MALILRRPRIATHNHIWCHHLGLRNPSTCLEFWCRQRSSSLTGLRQSRAKMRSPKKRNGHKATSVSLRTTLVYTTPRLLKPLTCFPGHSGPHDACRLCHPFNPARHSRYIRGQPQGLCAPPAGVPKVDSTRYLQAPARCATTVPERGQRLAA